MSALGQKRTCACALRFRGKADVVEESELDYFVAAQTRPSEWDSNSLHCRDIACGYGFSNLCTFWPKYRASEKNRL